MAKKTHEIVWNNGKAKLSDLKEWPENPRKILEPKYKKLVSLMKRYGYTNPIIVNADMTIIAGHQRKKGQTELHNEDYEVDIRFPSRLLTPEEMMELAIGDNLFTGVWDAEKLKMQFKPDELLKAGFTQKELNLLEAPKGKGGGEGEKKSVSFNAKSKYAVEIECDDAEHQLKVMQWLQDSDITNYKAVNR